MEETERRSFIVLPASFVNGGCGPRQNRQGLARYSMPQHAECRMQQQAPCRAALRLASAAPSGADRLKKR